MKNYNRKKTQGKRKERERKKRAIVPLQQGEELQSTKLCPTGLTGECGCWNCTNAQKLYMQAYLYCAENKLLASCYKQYNQTTRVQLQYMQVSHKTVQPSCWQYTCHHHQNTCVFCYHKRRKHVQQWRQIKAS